MDRTKQFTPEGVRDIRGRECRRKLALEHELMETMYSFGFSPVETPTFEYFDVFAKETGSVRVQDLYKFFDHEGNTLVLRPDVTPQIARSAAGSGPEGTKPMRLCYKGNTFINYSSYLGRAREFTQVGAEEIGGKGIHADAEMIALSIECLLHIGLSRFQISVGHALFLQALAKAAGMDEETEENLHLLLSNKNFFGVTELTDSLPMEGALKELFSKLGSFYANAGEMEELLAPAEGYPEIKKALSELLELDRILKLYGVNEYVTYEPGLHSSYRYYSGVLFAGYTYDVGEPVVKGGRYDRLLAHFGKEDGAVGFALTVDTLLNALVRQNRVWEPEEECEIITCTKENLPEAIKRAKRLRRAGKRAELVEVEE
ncbi:MAG: ATP phosphoribosyltransferase regulatory subunit [Lachnospiraceae bacterium]|nr:ATP phosphoribosyltransferase regulatory subunit [Lachnospiraceae bacterium]